MYRKRGDRVRCQVDVGGESRTRPEFQAECDINTILARYKKTGLVAHVQMVQGRYGDFVDARSYKEACDAIAAANTAFELLPSDIRARFKNDPAAFLSFAQDAANRDELEKMGLIRPKGPDVAVPTPEGGGGNADKRSGEAATAGASA